MRPHHIQFFCLAEEKVVDLLYDALFGMLALNGLVVVLAVAHAIKRPHPNE
jgi:hypothetical protein